VSVRIPRPASLLAPEDTAHEHIDPRKPHDTRTEFERDRSRILHAESFRRLQEKTQVFYGVRGASFRTRLTHSMEVALIAKALARKMGADPDLCETIALAHDVGHPPFGHNGESVLCELMRDHGGFEGNAQTLRIIRHLELKGHRYDGLNLTYATIDGVLKYKVPWSRASAGHSVAAHGVGARSDDARDLARAADAPKCVYDSDWAFVQEVSRARGTAEIESFECRILNIADDMAYCVADLQDGLAMDFLSPHALQEAAEGAGFFDEIVEFLSHHAPHVGEESIRTSLREVVDLHASIDAKARARSQRPRQRDALRTATSKELASKLHRRLVHGVGLTAEGLPHVEEPSLHMIQVLKAVTRTQTLRDVRLTTLDAACRKVVRRLFDAHANDYDLLPRWLSDRLRFDGLTTSEQLRQVCDHIAAMSDDAAMRAYRRLYEPGSQGLLDYI
jgi:dGTPase